MLVGLDGQGRVDLSRQLGAHARVASATSVLRWRLLLSADGDFCTDARGRLTVPVGVRVALGLDVSAGVSWRAGAVVVWSPALLDDAVTHP